MKISSLFSFSCLLGNAMVRANYSAQPFLHTTTQAAIVCDNFNRSDLSGWIKQDEIISLEETSFTIVNNTLQAVGVDQRGDRYTYRALYDFVDGRVNAAESRVSMRVNVQAGGNPKYNARISLFLGMPNNSSEWEELFAGRNAETVLVFTLRVENVEGDAKIRVILGNRDFDAGETDSDEKELVLSAADLDDLSFDVEFSHDDVSGKAKAVLSDFSKETLADIELPVGNFSNIQDLGSSVAVRMQGFVDGQGNNTILSVDNLCVGEFSLCKCTNSVPYTCVFLYQATTMMGNAPTAGFSPFARITTAMDARVRSLGLLTLVACMSSGAMCPFTTRELSPSSCVFDYRKSPSCSNRIPCMVRN